MVRRRAANGHRISISMGLTGTKDARTNQRINVVPLRVGFDLDGVLADMESELVRHAEILFGEPMTRRLQDLAALGAGDAKAAPAVTDSVSDAPAGAEGESSGPLEGAPPIVRLQMTVRQQRRLWRHVEGIENFWETLKEIEPGTVARLAAIASDRRWEVIFLTKRPAGAGATAQVQTQRWLQAKGFTLPSVYVVQGSRGRIAEALGLDFVIDDRPENCLDVVVDSKARAILVWREDANQLPAAARRLGIGVVKSVDECLNILTQIDASPADKPGVLERVMRLLGLKEPASV